VFFSARHHADFWLLGTEAAGTVQQVEFWADAKPERAATAAKTVAYNIVNGFEQSINVWTQRRTLAGRPDEVVGRGGAVERRQGARRGASEVGENRFMAGRQKGL
jgi:hypothetical protein